MQLKWSRFNVEVPVPQNNAVVIFNTLTRDIVSVDQELINSLRETEFAQLSEQELLRLRDAKIVVDQGLDEVAYMRYLLGEQKYTRAGLGLFLCFTADCNLKCSYCFEDYREGLQAKRDLTWSKFESLLRFIDDQKDSWGLRHLDVVFFGGEPLMNYEVVFRAAKALKEYEKNSISVTIDMITNGTLLTTERCRELAPYIDMMQVTLDGPKDVHDQRRPYRDGKGTYDDIVDNLETAIEYCKNIIVMPVVDGHNAPFIPELLRQLSDRGMHNKLAVGFSHTCLSQSAVVAGGCSGTLDLEIFRTITQLYTVAAQLGYSIAKTFIKGPCLRSSVNRFAVDEHLNVHKCPADLYGAHPDATINEAGRLDILRSNWYESVAFEPPCVASCIYGPICYGGCKWQAGGSTKRECHKEWLDLFIVDAIRTYVISHYEKKLQNHQV